MGKVIMIKKYWPEIMVFGAIFGVLLLTNLPGLTWINTDSDGAHYLLSAKYMGVAHNTSAPLYLLLGRLFLYLPFGSEPWRMGLISVIATSIASIFIYKVVMWHLLGWRINKMVRKMVRREKIDSIQNYARAYALIASLIYGGSVLVISQSTIIETYALTTCLSVIAYYCAIQGKWLKSSIAMGLTLAIHPLFFLGIWLVLFIAHKEFRTIKYQLIIWGFILFYLYVPISKLYSEIPPMWGNESVAGFFKNNFGTMWMLVGGLSLFDIPKRILDTLAILGVSMGLSLIVVCWYFIKERTLKSKLLWLFVLPVFYFIINLSAETYVYMMPAIAFGAIATGIALSKLKPVWLYSTGLVAILLLAYNANYMDIGRTLDPNLSAQSYYNNELPKLKDGDIFLGGGWTWAIVYLYNRQEGRNIIPVCTDVLPSQEYLDIVETEGIKLTRTDSESFIDKQWLVAKSIVEQNDNVWIAKEINPATLEYELVPGKDNMWLIDRWLGYEKEPQIAWKPSNPYAFITGALEVSEWKFILKTEHNARLAIIWSIYGIGFYILVERLFKRENSKKKKTATAAR